MEISAVFKEVQNHFVSNTENIILSTEETIGLNNRVYVIISDKATNKELFTLQINCEFFCSIFRDLTIWNDFVVIGFDNYCYLFNYKTKNIVHYKLKSYFDSIYVSDENVYVCSASNINCFNSNGSLQWQSEKLGIHSVKISKIENNTIQGSGDWDEIEGWKAFEFPIDYYANPQQNRSSNKTKTLLKKIKSKAKAVFQE